jgi:hypothetical protein
MSDGELEVLHAHLKRAKRYLEFGSGDSTLHAANTPSIESIDSVESSHRYIDENLRPKPEIKQAIEAGRLQFHIVDLGETKEWGYPKDDSKKHLWPNYSLAVFSEPSQHDLVLIDGRFRVACALSCLLNTPDNCTIMIHDFWNRTKFYFLLRYFEVEHEVDKLGVFKKKANLNPDTLQKQLKRYQYIVHDNPLSARLKRPFIKKRYRQAKP